MIDVALNEVETPEAVAEVIAQAAKHVPKERILPCTNCDMTPMDRDVGQARGARHAGARGERERWG